MATGIQRDRPYGRAFAPSTCGHAFSPPLGFFTILFHSSSQSVRFQRAVLAEVASIRTREVSNHRLLFVACVHENCATGATIAHYPLDHIIAHRSFLTTEGAWERVADRCQPHAYVERVQDAIATYACIAARSLEGGLRIASCAALSRLLSVSLRCRPPRCH